MYLHTFSKHDPAREDIIHRFISPIHGLNIRKLKNQPIRQFSPEYYQGPNFVIVSDCLMHQKNSAGFIVMYEEGEIQFDCEVILSLPISLRKGDKYTWETIEC